MADKNKISIVDSHLHVWDLAFRDGCEIKTPSHFWPSEAEPEINRNIDLAEAEKSTSKNSVKNALFVMCFDDCPEESRLIYRNAQNYPFLKVRN